MQTIKPETTHDPITYTAEAEAHPWWAVTAYWTPRNWVVRMYHSEEACPSIELFTVKSRRKAFRLAKEAATKLNQQS